MTPSFRKIRNLLSARTAIALHREKISATPAVAFMEVSNVCNIRCRMCATTFDPRFQKGTGYTGLMDIALLDRLEPILPGLWRAYLMGNGEPLLNPNFLEFARRLKQHRVEIQFNTNGMLLTPDLSEELVVIGADAIAISIDGANAETFNHIRRGADFDQVIVHVKALNHIKAQMHSAKPKLTLAAVALKDNIDQIPQLVELAKELGMGHVHIEPLIWQDDPAYQEYYQEHSLTEVEEAARAKLMQASATARELKISFSTPLLDFQRSERPKGIPCWEPWTTIFVTWQGEIHPCCGSEQVMGNLPEQSILDIWNGADYRRLRKDMAQGLSPEGCRSCMKNQRMKRAIPTFKQWIKKAVF
jgi:radical SAM protein with 4Fe4S-binding SPASM domain